MCRGTRPQYVTRVKATSCGRTLKYNMEHLTKTLRSVGNKCEPQHIVLPGYAACDALLDSAFPLVSEQMPVLGPRLHRHTADVAGYPVSQVTACLYLDLCSILTLHRQGVLPPYMTMVMSTPTYDNETMIHLGKAYVELTRPASSSGATFITRSGHSWSLTMVHRSGNSVEAVSTTPCWSTLDDVIAYLRSDSANGKCLAICHDEPDSDNAAVLSSMRVVAWSIGSTSACSPTFKPAARRSICHLLPIYTHPGSTYMRILSTEGIMNPVYGESGRQTGDTGMYNCTIRGSRTRTGKCWDCQCLHTLAVAMEELLQSSPKSTTHDLTSSISGLLDPVFTDIYMSSLDQ